MKKNGKFLKIFTAILAAAVCFASGLITARLMPEKENNDAKEIQEHLAESVVLPATVKVLEEISLDVDPSARGDVYPYRAIILQNMYNSSAYRNEYFLIKLVEFLPWTETGDMSEFIKAGACEPSEYIAVYLYGIRDEYGHMKYALQWGDVIVGLDRWMLENYYIEVVKGKIEGASENSEMLVIWNYDGFCVEAYVKEGKTITQYSMRGIQNKISNIYSVAASEEEVTVYTHDTALSVKVEGENEWDKKKFGCESSLMTQLTLYTYIAAYREDDNSPNPRKTHVAKLYGDIYLDTENDQFIVRDFYLTK